MADLSRAAGKNAAYAQQFLKRGVPEELPEDVRERVGAKIGVHPDALREGSKAASPQVAPPIWTGLPDKLHPASNARPAPDVPLPGDIARATIENDVPIYGVGEAGENGHFPINMNDGPIGFAPRPPGIAHNRKVFAAYVVGGSMSPWREAGDVIYVMPDVPLRPGCHVLLTFETGPGEPPSALIKQFIRQDTYSLTLRQYSPADEFVLDREQIHYVWRILETREVLGL